MQVACVDIFLGHRTSSNVSLNRKMKCMAIDLDSFRTLNVARARDGFRCYDNQPLTYWTTALAGEVGELCNMIKKLQRVEKGGVDGGSSYKASDITREKMKEEIGGIAIYLDLLASLLDIGLEEAMVDTFNAKSKALGFPHRWPTTGGPASPHQSAEMP